MADKRTSEKLGHGIEQALDKAALQRKVDRLEYQLNALETYITSYEATETEHADIFKYALTTLIEELKKNK